MKKLAAIFAAAAISASAFAQETTTQPQFPGGQPALDEYIATNIKYPAPALKNGIEGVVTLVFTVLPDGKIDSITVERMIDPDLEAEAIRLVKGMPAWTPATLDDKPVASPYTLKIIFTLPE